MAMTKTQLARFVYKLFSETLMEDLSQNGSRYACRNVKIVGDRARVENFLEVIVQDISTASKGYNAEVIAYENDIYEFVLEEAELDFASSCPHVIGDDDSLFVSEAEELDE